MASEAKKPFARVLDPIDRVSEILFGLIMVLTSTGTLSIMTAGRTEVRDMIIGALGCNLAWGIIDAGLYLMGCIDERAHNILAVRAAKRGDPETARQAIGEALPDPVTSVLSHEDIDSLRAKLARLPEPPSTPRLTWNDLLGAVAICLLVFLSTFPPILPFLFMDAVQPALRVSNVIAIAMLFMCGVVYARHTGLHPGFTGLVMVLIGTALVGVAILLGG